jgi:hypothetical protein
MIRLLLDRGVNINGKQNGCKPLLCSTVRSKEDVNAKVELPLSQGTDAKEECSYHCLCEDAVKRVFGEGRRRFEAPGLFLSGYTGRNE